VVRQHKTGQTVGNGFHEAPSFRITWRWAGHCLASTTNYIIKSC
jgi:hypothetical protein